jgi:hypothetical protein
MEIESLRAALALFLPDKALDYFDITDATLVNDEIHLTLTEKNVPPETTDGTIPVFKGYKDIIVSDFPVRGKHVALTFRRRYWKAQGTHEMLTRDIPLVFPGTKLERAFADFLKAGGGDRALLLGEYRAFFPSPDQGV